MVNVFTSVAAQLAAATIPVLVALWLAGRRRSIAGLALAISVVFAIYVACHIASTMVVTKTVNLTYAAKFVANMFSSPAIPLVWVAFSVALFLGFYLRTRRGSVGVRRA
jgi:uncharacterized membrane protein